MTGKTWRYTDSYEFMQQTRAGLPPVMICVAVNGGILDLDGAALLAADPIRGPGQEADGSIRFNQEPGLGVTRAA